MTTNNVTTPRPERKGLGEGQIFLFISVLLLGLFHLMW